MSLVCLPLPRPNSLLRGYRYLLEPIHRERDTLNEIRDMSVIL